MQLIMNVNLERIILSTVMSGKAHSTPSPPPRKKDKILNLTFFPRIIGPGKTPLASVALAWEALG
jgi:hypothetical protein